MTPHFIFTIFFVVASLFTSHAFAESVTGNQLSLLPAQSVAPTSVPAALATALGEKPVNGMAFDGEGRLWLLQADALYSYDPKLETVRRLVLPTTARDGSLGQLHVDGNLVFVASQRSLYIAQLSPQKLWRLHHPLFHGGKSLGFSGQGDRLTWLHSDAAMRIDRYGKSLSALDLGPDVPNAETACLGIDDRTLWLVTPPNRAHESRVFALDLKVKRARATALDVLREPLIKMSCTDEGVLITTARSARLFGESKQTARKIPVLSQEPLVGAAFSPTDHYYLSAHGRLFRFVLSNKESHLMYLDWQSHSSMDAAIIATSSISNGSNWIAIAQKSKLALFQLP